jgi:hypothetical protein
MKETKVDVRTRVRAGEKVSAATEISRAGIYTVGIASALIGLWGFASFVGGMVASGGPISLIGNWFKAVAGM